MSYNPDEDRNGMRRALVPVPDDLWPGKNLFSAIVRRSRVDGDALGNYVLNESGVMVLGVSKFKDWALRDPLYDEVYGEHVWAGAQNLTYENETMQFFWVPARSAEQRRQPIRVNFQTDKYHWDPVAKALTIIVDKNFAGGGDQNQIATTRRYLLKAGSRPSKIETRTYLSNTEWGERAFELNVPVPTEIQGDYYGKEILIEPCLHKRVQLKSLGSSDRVLLDCLPGGQRARLESRRTLEATDHTTWQKQVFDVEQKTWNGMHFLFVRIAHPPEEPPPEIR